LTFGSYVEGLEIINVHNQWVSLLATLISCINFHPPHLDILDIYACASMKFEWLPMLKIELSINYISWVNKIIDCIFGQLAKDGPEWMR